MFRWSGYSSCLAIAPLLPSSYAVAILDYAIFNFVSRGCGFALANCSSCSITTHAWIISARGEENILVCNTPVS